MYGYKGQVKWVTQKAFVSLHMPYLSAPPLPPLAFGLPVISIDLHLLPLCLLC